MRKGKVSGWGDQARSNFGTRTRMWCRMSSGEKEMGRTEPMSQGKLLASWSCGRTMTCFPSVSRRFLSAGYPIIVVESVRRRPLVTRRSAEDWMVSLVAWFKDAACWRPRNVSGASWTVRSAWVRAVLGSESGAMDGTNSTSLR